ncbi:MAG: hypothetical protein L6R39_000155 [Caloplaca ligustica]|nr:MAG: hypothetical protein L6R39_000155 [Caloplaca ligustica]
MTYIQAAFSAFFSPSVSITLCTCVPFAIIVFYRLFLHSLSHIPGPLLARISSLPLYTICFLGIECRVLEFYHRRYKVPVLRIAPNAVSISDGAALHPIYVAGGGYPKTARYENFKVGGHDTIFSSRDPAYRDVRAKAVAPLFAMSRVRAAGLEAGIIRQCIRTFMQRFECEKASAKKRAPEAAKVDVLGLTYRLMMDSVTGYLFGHTYGALEERPVSLAPAKAASFNVESGSSKMSALPFIFAIVEAGRFSLLPNWLFSTLSSIVDWLFPNEEFHHSLECVRAFAMRLTEEADPKIDDTYQARLLAAGVAKPETIVQCMAVMFAGTDSTAVKLVTIIFHLVRNPNIHERLKKELGHFGKDPATDPQTIAYLRAVVKEGLRLGMANPGRFSRTTPPGGLEIGGVHIPGGTDVGLAPYTLHHNAEVFAEPFMFRPERWLDEGKEGTCRPERLRREMERDLIPFNVGLRACIARNFAVHKLFVATKAIVESGVLEGARTCTNTIELQEFFNVGIKDHKLEIIWSS